MYYNVLQYVIMSHMHPYLTCLDSVSYLTHPEECQISYGLGTWNSGIPPKSTSSCKAWWLGITCGGNKQGGPKTIVKLLEMTRLMVDRHIIYRTNSSGLSIIIGQINILRFRMYNYEYLQPLWLWSVYGIAAHVIHGLHKSTNIWATPLCSPSTPSLAVASDCTKRRVGLAWRVLNKWVVASFWGKTNHDQPWNTHLSIYLSIYQSI